MGDVTKLLQADDDGDIEEAETGARSAGEVSPALPPPQVSAAQRERLRIQAFAINQVLERESDRDLLSLGELEAAKQAVDALAATATQYTRKKVDEKVWNHMNEASLIRLRFTMLAMAAEVAEAAEVNYKPSTILSWVRDFRKLGGRLKHDGRGVYERGWILSKEDLELDMLGWLKSQKRV